MRNMLLCAQTIDPHLLLGQGSERVSSESMLGLLLLYDLHQRGALDSTEDEAEPYAQNAWRQTSSLYMNRRLMTDLMESGFQLIMKDHVVLQSFDNGVRIHQEPVAMRFQQACLRLALAPAY